MTKIMYQQDHGAVLAGIQIYSQGFVSPFFCRDKNAAATKIYMSDLYDDDGYFICDNIGARVEPNGTISNIYFNQEYTALKRVGYKRGKGTLSNVDWDEDEEVIGIYGNYKMVDGERRGYSALGLIVWTPYPT